MNITVKKINGIDPSQNMTKASIITQATTPDVSKLSVNPPLNRIQRRKPRRKAKIKDFDATFGKEQNKLSEKQGKVVVFDDFQKRHWQQFQEKKTKYIKKKQSQASNNFPGEVSVHSYSP